MSKFKTINLLDKIFITAAVFLLIYAWINFFVRNLYTTFILSLIFTAAVVFLIFYLFYKKKEKNTNTKRYLKDVEQKFLAFRLLSKTEQLSLLVSIIKKDFTSRILNDCIIYKKDNLTHLMIIATHIEKINEFDFINLLQGKKNINKIKIICNDYNPVLNTKIVNKIDVDFVTPKKLYDEYFYKHSTFPNTDILNTKKEQKKMKEILKNFFIPTRAKSYFLCGLILIFSSIILPYHTYNLIFGSTLLILSIICKLQPLFKR